MEESQHHGTVDYYNETGGYGFIETGTIDKDVFFHIEDIELSELQEDADVIFEFEQAEKGPRAVSVQREANSSQNEQSEDTEVFDSRDTQSGENSTSESANTEVYESETDDGSGMSEEISENTSQPDFCPYCGADLSNYPNGSFCSNCGKQL